MAQSLFQPVKLEPLAWDWNPGQTFVTAFNNAQENRRRNEELAMEQELTRILLPYKQQTAALELEKLQQEVERSTLLTKRLREGSAVAHRGIMQGLQNPQSASKPNQTDPNPFMIDTTGANFKPTTSRTTSNPRTVVLPTE